MLMGLTGAASYRRLESLDSRVDEAWQQVLAASEARVESAEALASAFPTTNAAVVASANQALHRAEGISAPDASDLAAFAASQAALDQWVEQTPSDAQLAAEQETVLAARAAFNDATLAYNRTRRRFPTVLIALAAGFSDRPYLDAPPEVPLEH